MNEVFHRALELEGDARERYLEQTCGSDAGLLGEVRTLLDADAKAGGFLDTPAGLADEAAPSDIGPWRVVRELGRGGMGTVFLAERNDGAFTMQAALKLMRRGLDTDDLLARFRDERQILASLEHPNIARLLDGGATPDGRPWLAMEYVDGETLLEWCTARALDVPARLALFRKLTAAVQYAHRNLVVHRDLKPGNVLVTKSGELKLLDFGIAKVLGERGEERTRTGQQVLTPAYASPEQVRGERVTTAADVWALGVILHELLVGRRPFEGSGETLSRAILEQELAAPKLGADLDTVLFAALRKEPELRYQSVEALADDLSRLESGLPLRARPATFGYRVGKFVRRNRVGVAAAVLVVLTLAGGVVATLLQAQEARAARARAEASRARAEELVDFMLVDLRRKLEPSSRLDVLEDVSKAVQTYFEQSPDDASPTRRARMLQQLATAKLAQSKADEASALISRGAALLETAPVNAESDGLRAATANLLGQVLETKGDLDGALAQYALEAGFLEKYPVTEPRVRALVADAHNSEGRVLYFLGKLDDAVKQHEQALRCFEGATLSTRDDRFSRTKVSLYLGRAKEGLGALKEAEAAFTDTLTRARALHADFPQDLELEDFLSIALNDLGRVARLQGRPGDAETLADESVKLSLAALARDPQNSIRVENLSAAHSFLGRAREELGKLELAKVQFEADLALSERLLAQEPDNAFVQAAVADGLGNVGRVERKLGHADAARTFHQRALDVRLALAAKDEGFKTDVALSHLELGRALRLGKGDAKAQFEKALALYREVATAADAPAKQRGRYAQTLLELGLADEAAPVVKALVDADAADAELRAMLR